MTIPQAFELAVQHHQAGRLAEAEAIYRQILAAEPRQADTLHMLGVLAHQVGQNEVAVDLIRQAIAILPVHPAFHSNLGEAHRALAQTAEAIAAYREALRLKPDYAEALNNLGNALTQQGEPEQAIVAFREAIQLNPSSAEIHNNLGSALKDTGQLDASVAAFHQAIALTPAYPEAHCNLGGALIGKDRLDEAVAACRQAIALNPDYPEAYCNLGVALKESGGPDEAIAAYRQAIAISPQLPEAYNNLGSALRGMGQPGEAVAAYRQAVVLKPDYPEAHGSLVLALNYHPGSDSHAIAAEQRRWNQQHADPMRRFIQPHPNDRTSDRRLRIGYVSADFREHVVAYNVLALLSRHDARDFEIFCYAQVTRPDALTERFRASVHHWRSTVGLSDGQVASQIREDAIDILVDLALHTAGNRLPVFARKPAPVQVTFAGYPGSTGLATIDYRLSDPFLDPPGMDELIYSEQTMRLPHSFWCYDPLDCRDIPVHALPAESNGFLTFGCLNNFCKINDSVLRLWASVLRAVPSSRLILLAAEGSHRPRTAELLAQEGIASGRIEFVSFQPRRKYLEMYHRIDISLDTLPYNGHTTSLDSLWMGVPVVTLVGQTIVGRAGLCQLMNLNLPDLIASTPDQFVQIASALASDLPRLAALRSSLRSRMEASPLMDAPRFARDIEAAYREMWSKWCVKEERPIKDGR